LGGGPVCVGARGQKVRKRGLQSTAARAESKTERRKKEKGGVAEGKKYPGEKEPARYKYKREGDGERQTPKTLGGQKRKGKERMFEKRNVRSGLREP